MMMRSVEFAVCSESICSCRRSYTFSQIAQARGRGLATGRHRLFALGFLAKVVGYQPIEQDDVYDHHDRQAKRSDAKEENVNALTIQHDPSSHIAQGQNSKDYERDLR